MQSDVDGYNPSAIWQDIQNLTRTLTPEGIAYQQRCGGVAGANGAEGDARAPKPWTILALLLGEDLLTATFWMDVRRAQSPGRDFGRAPTAAWTAFRQAVPWQRSRKTGRTARWATSSTTS